MPEKPTAIMFAMCIAVVGCTSTSDVESISYATYAKTQHVEIIDLVGASNISARFASEIDSSDYWIAFTISREDFAALVATVARDNDGPSEIEWSESAAFPAGWHPAHSQPSWWEISPTKDFRAVSWFHATESLNCSGWYFFHDARTDSAVCRHWRYQHADEMCGK